MSVFGNFKKIFRKKPSLSELKEKYKELLRNCIGVEIKGAADGKSLTYFGGAPYVPKGFKWPYFETDSIDDSAVKLRPLSFLAQFDCRDFAAYDKDNLLPHTGVLSFFYSVESNRWGFDPKDEGCSRVYWFENTDELIPAPFPADLAEDYRFPSMTIALTAADSYPDYESPGKYDSDEYDEFFDALHADDGESITKLLGWADAIQSEMEPECELIGGGYYLGNSRDNIPRETRDEAARVGRDKWRLLLQLDTVEDGDFELMFGDGGRIYFWIRSEDLANRRFDRTWLILQCY